MIETRADEHRVELARGEVRATISAPPRIFFVNTPSATVVDYGCAYTLNVDDEGSSVLHVTEGWVALVLNNRQSLVPASAYCKTKRGIGPGTPFFEDASGKFADALTRFDFEQGGSSALEVILAEARKRDALSLWYLLQRTGDADRSRVYDTLVRLVPLTEGVTREGVVRLDPQMLDVWKETIDIVSVGESFSAHTDAASWQAW